MRKICGIIAFVTLEENLFARLDTSTGIEK